MENTKSSNFKRYFQFAVVVLAAGSIYPIVYMRTSFQGPMLETFGIDIAILGGFYAVLGFMNLFGYIPSGWLADRMSSKLLLSLSMLITGVAGIWYAQIPNVNYIRIIFLIWGFSTVLTFWGSHMKIIKLIAGRDEQGRFFGMLEGGKGLVEAVIATVVVAVFNIIATNQPTPELTRQALVTVIYIFSILNIALSFIVYFILDEPKKDEVSEASNENKMSAIDGVKKALKIPEVWLVSGIIFCAYIVYWPHYYMGGYLATNQGLPQATVGIITAILMWMRPLSAGTSGFVADKFGRPLILGISIICSSVMLFVLANLPQGAVNVYVLSAFVIFAALAYFFIRGLYWSILDYCDIPPSITGFAIGLISFLGYSGDIFIPLFSGNLFNKFEATTAYSYYYMISGLFGVFAIILLFILNKRIKKSGKFTN